MSPFDTIAKAVYRRPLTVYVVSILVPVALTLALVRPRGKTFGTLSEFRCDTTSTSVADPAPVSYTHLTLPTIYSV